VNAPEAAYMTDAVEKGQNEPIEIFVCSPVGTGFS
jgi:hypothetical protein